MNHRWTVGSSGNEEGEQELREEEDEEEEEKVSLNIFFPTVLGSFGCLV